MKSAFNCFTCLGILFFLGGGFLVAAGLMGGWGMVASGIGGVILFIGLFLIFLQFRIAGRWNKVVGIIKSHESITIQEASGKSGVSLNKINDIIYQAISSGDLTGTMKGDTFSRTKTVGATSTADSAKVLVLCPYCGSKTEQGLPNCQKCGADL